LLFVFTTSVYIFIHRRLHSCVGLVIVVRLHLSATKSALYFPRYPVRSNSSKESSSIDGYHLDNIDSYIHRHQTAQSSRRHYHHCPVFPSGTNSLIFVLQRHKIWHIYMHFVHKPLVQVMTDYTRCMWRPMVYNSLYPVLDVTMLVAERAWVPSMWSRYSSCDDERYKFKSMPYLWHHPLLHNVVCTYSIVINVDTLVLAAAFRPHCWDLPLVELWLTHVPAFTPGVQVFVFGLLIANPFLYFVCPITFDIHLTHLCCCV
jgi:hypothetical protein